MECYRDVESHAWLLDYLCREARRQNPMRLDILLVTARGIDCCRMGGCYIFFAWFDRDFKRFIRRIDSHIANPILGFKRDVLPVAANIASQLLGLRRDILQSKLDDTGLARMYAAFG